MMFKRLVIISCCALAGFAFAAGYRHRRGDARLNNAQQILRSPQPRRR